LTGALYLTCPRRDAISNLNVNNVRAADFQIINYIHNRENGKDGYLVYANQILGAAAILNYGFGPYYQSPWGNLFYYSTPMASETNQRFEMAMRADNFNYQGLAEVAAEIGVKRFYFIVTSYWPLNTEAEIQMEAVADEKVSLGGGDYVFFFTIK
jgi:hypothetical protein